MTAADLAESLRVKLLASSSCGVRIQTHYGNLPLESMELWEQDGEVVISVLGVGAHFDGRPNDEMPKAEPVLSAFDQAEHDRRDRNGSRCNG